MAEYIEREAALEAAKKSHLYFDLKPIINSIPTADVRPVVRGKWTLNKDGSGTCSECGFVQNSCWDLDNWDNFCHHCGADMREES
jgi:hypothetical protein